MLDSGASDSHGMDGSSVNENLPASHLPAGIRLGIGFACGALYGALLLTSAIELQVLFMNRYFERQAAGHSRALPPAYVAEVTEIRNSGLRSNYKKLTGSVVLFSVAALPLSLALYRPRKVKCLAMVPLLAGTVFYIWAGYHNFNTKIKPSVDDDIEAIRPSSDR